MSFFKKPSWAIKNTGEASTDFYRRSEQTYSDIIAASREAHQKPKSPEIPEHIEDTKDTEDPKQKSGAGFLGKRGKSAAIAVWRRM